MFAACQNLCDFEIKITFDLIMGYTLLIFGDP